ncbi:metal-sulfur cluster biosynthetic enzyme [Flavobacterium arsenatis]|uniref:Metal-sulfur cluster biosynthetic enzyme n=1 Tax=Flavobacterium arsenatis TaxID=1484332 RepID=A0ABU1TK12_9FLAO|nr:hypothetical protein [Flavobacterium arsenatis]MDR6966313.1 metal-sulfur cluster biosynthetic enzyme [Flavobacterium arsenatis]
MNAEDKKEELMEWLSKVEEPSILYQVAKIKEESEADIKSQTEKIWDFFIQQYLN